MTSLLEKRDRLYDRIHDQSGVESVGICKREGKLSLLVLVNENFDGLEFSQFDDIPVVIESANQGEAYSHSMP